MPTRKPPPPRILHNCRFCGRDTTSRAQICHRCTGETAQNWGENPTIISDERASERPPREEDDNVAGQP